MFWQGATSVSDDAVSPSNIDDSCVPAGEESKRVFDQSNGVHKSSSNVSCVEPSTHHPKTFWHIEQASSKSNLRVLRMTLGTAIVDWHVCESPRAPPALARSQYWGNHAPTKAAQGALQVASSMDILASVLSIAIQDHHC